MLRKAFDFFLFSSLYIALCAVVMTHQANKLLYLPYSPGRYLSFVFFSTIGSYNFHWYLTPYSKSEWIRVEWMHRHKHFNLILLAIGLIGCIVLFFTMWKYCFWLMIPAALTFLYSAPKIPLPFFRKFKEFAIGKTIYLAFVWTYVTSMAPVFISGKGWELPDILFCVERFFLIYAICIIFDYRDREQDRQEGIRSMITWFSDRAIDGLFYGSLAVFVISTVALYFFHWPAWMILVLLLPGIIVLALYNISKKNFSDYLYYFVLDGLMMFSALLTLFLPI